ncbi:MAG: hypothetical protein ACRC9V_05310 [Aeromonas sp.]
MTTPVTIGAASLMGTGAVSEIMNWAANLTVGSPLQATSFVPFTLCLPEIGLVCKPYSTTSVVLADTQALQQSLHSAIQIAELNKSARMLDLAYVDATPEPEPEPDVVAEVALQAEPEPEQVDSVDQEKATTKTRARNK